MTNDNRRGGRIPPLQGIGAMEQVPECLAFTYDDGGRGKYIDAVKGDCVIRAIAILTELDYLYVHYRIREELDTDPDTGIVVEKLTKTYFWKGLGFGKLIDLRTKRGKAKIATKRFVECFPPAEQRCMVLLKSHATAWKDGRIFDTYNCSEAKHKLDKIYGYYVYNKIHRQPWIDWEHQVWCKAIYAMKERE